MQGVALGRLLKQTPLAGDKNWSIGVAAFDSLGLQTKGFAMRWNEADLAMQSAPYSSDLSTFNRFVDAGFALVSNLLPAP